MSKVGHLKLLGLFSVFFVAISVFPISASRAQTIVRNDDHTKKEHGGDKEQTVKLPDTRNAVNSPVNVVADPPADPTPSINQPPVVTAPVPTPPAISQPVFSQPSTSSPNHQTSNQPGTPTFTPGPPDGGGPINTSHDNQNATSSQTASSASTTAVAPFTSPGAPTTTPVILPSLRPQNDPTANIVDSVLNSLRPKTHKSVATSTATTTSLLPLALTSVFDGPPSSPSPSFYANTNFDAKTTRFLLAYAVVVALAGVFLTANGAERLFVGRPKIREQGA